MKKLSRLLLPALLLAVFTGCATAKVSEFEAFASAGTAYTEAVTGLITQVGEGAVNANSVKLLQNRALAPVSLSDFQQQDKDMRDYLAELTEIQAQTTLLGNYFEALADLATSSAPESFATEVQSVATTLMGVTQEVRGTSVAQSTQTAAASAAGGIGGLVVKEIQGKELERELNARKDAIAQILKLQEDLLTVLSSQAEANAQFTTALDYNQEVVTPFMSGQVTTATQSSWMSERYSLLSQPVLVTQVKTAAQAAQSLQQAWNKLLSNDFTAEDAQAITTELAPILASLDTLKAQKQSTTTTTSTSSTTGTTGESQP